MKDNKNTPNTQSFLEIDHIQNGIVFMKDGSLRKVLMTSSLNFSLQSEAEQDALIGRFQDLLNSFDHPVQILVQSRRVALDNYLANIKAIGSKTTDEYARVHIAEYYNFLGEIVEKANIMDKKFYIIIPFFFSGLPGMGTKAEVEAKSQSLTEGINMLNQRVSATTGTLKSMGINSLDLDTEALIELYYISYNPGTVKLTNAAGAALIDRPVVTPTDGGNENV